MSSLCTWGHRVLINLGLIYDWPKITTIVTDVDGVFTDGKFTYTKDGKISKVFGPHDSDGIKLLKKIGINVVAITADKRGFDITLSRMNDMGVYVVLVNEHDRADWFSKNFDATRTAFVGDGYYDAEVMRKTHVSFAPANAVEEAKRNTRYVLKTPGGSGVFLEIYRIIKEKNL